MNGELRKEKIQHLKKAMAFQQMVFQKVQNKADNIVRASFLVSEKIAKHSKPYSDGEFVKECLSAVVNMLCPEKEWNVTMYVSLIGQ